jgi:23S rRNA (cytosine1962-C5)-methyltransferase
MVTRRRLEKRYAEEEARAPLPREGEPLPRVELRAERHGRHPWIYRRMLREPEERLAPGQLVEAVARDGRFVGRGFYNAGSEIALRLLSDDPNVFPGEAWFRDRVAEAVRLRHDVLRLPDATDAYRVVHAEGDRLSGLVVDRFAGVLVAELFSAGMHRHWPWIAAALDAAFPGLGTVVRADWRVEKQEGVKMEGPEPPAAESALVVREGPARFEIDLRRGHKTGFFLDQRENRARMAALCKGEDLFDGFCYTGGFAVHAALAGAASVLAVDLDEDAVEVALRNRKLNGLGASVSFQHGNVFDVLRGFKQSGRRFSRMVLDPPKLARGRDEVAKALIAYKDMNRLGMQCLKPGGVLLSCSCTGLVQEADLLEALRFAASEARAELQVLLVAGAAPDHPWLSRMPEGRYLKAVFARVVPRM